MAGVTARGLLEEMRRRGVRLAVEDGTLKARAPKGKLADLFDPVHDHRAEIVELLQAEQAGIEWRIEAMRPQVPARGPVPLLVARPEAIGVDAPGHCLSCGETMPPASRFRCPPCVRAGISLLSEIRG